MITNDNGIQRKERALVGTQKNARLKAGMTKK
jgi:hypothetical protein